MIDGNQFVGTVTVLLGLSMLVASGVNHAFLFQLTIPRVLDQRLGRQSARLVIIVLGISFCLLGVAIMMKWVARPSVSNLPGRMSYGRSVSG